MASSIGLDTGIPAALVLIALTALSEQLYVVVGRRTDQAHSWCRVASLCHPRVDLVTWKLAALPRLGPLGHLDLEVVGVGEVGRGDAEPT